MNICPKCQYRRVPSDTAPDWQCPKCGVAYNKAMSSTSRTDTRARENVVSAHEPGMSGKTILFALVLISLAGFGIWKTFLSHSSVPQATTSDRFNAAKKAFDADDFVRATREFTALAEGGDAKAQYYLGRIYALDWTGSGFDGKGASQRSDREKSVYWYTKAAQQGELLAQLALGKLYASNLGGGTDPNGESAKWYRMATDQGDPGAQYVIGSYYELGRGVAKDMTQASQWYRGAAEQGHAGGLFGLGMLYTKGAGVVENQLTAYKLLLLAAAKNERDPGEDGAFWARKRSEELATKLSRSELAEANAFVAVWQPGKPLPR